MDKNRDTDALKNVAELSSEQVVVFKFQDGRLIRLPKVTLTDEPLTISTKDGVMSYSLADIAIINPEPWMLGVGHHWTGSLIFALELQIVKNLLDTHRLRL